MHQGCIRSRQRRREERRGGRGHRQAVGGREAYYTRELATDHEQYLSGHGESPGRWCGAGARSLGLQGEASRGGFQAHHAGMAEVVAYLNEHLGARRGRGA
jgi:TrwC relaxase